MTSAIQEALKRNHEEMQYLIEKQVFNVEDSQLFLKEYYKVIMKVEELEISRDNWKKKYEELKLKFIELQGGIKHGK